MKPYQIFESERTTIEDRITGAKIHQLTDYMGHSVHPYFTEDGWYDNDSRMLFTSDRELARNLYSLHLESGEISRLTNFSAGDIDLKSHMPVNKIKNESYFVHNNCLHAISLDTLEIRPLYIIPHGFRFWGGMPTADGKYVVGGLMALDKAGANMQGKGYIGFRERFESKPDCRIIRIDVTNRSVDEVWQEYCLVGHINPSTTLPNIITFCHEGPWPLVDNRIWMLDMNTGKAIKIRERRIPEEQIGHEYWLADGETIAYQVHDNTGTWFGFSKYNGEILREAESCKHPQLSPDHVHSLTMDYVVGDSGRGIHAFQYNGKEYEKARLLCTHDSTFDFSAYHPHPRITNDGKHVIFNSMRSSYCNIYMIDIPSDFYSLPIYDLDME